MATVRITVEFAAGVETHLADLEVTAPAWKYVQRHKRKLKVFGTEHFGFDKRIDDMTVGRFCSGKLELDELSHQPPHSVDTVVVVLESPHKNEYALRQPLVRSRDRLMRNVTLLCGFYLPQKQADVIVCNPIQWQASLAEYYKFIQGEEPRDLLKSVRKDVWEHLWNHHEDDRYPAREGFMTRVRNYRPLLVINACTAELHHHVQDELAQLPGVPVVDALHPSCWRMLKES
ncbi:hypothetical protein [Hyalangium rubrum]|uniref:Uncharacterized protein n=1 Tax=Hyalangium rubrum TaxID=3103134 RepID=A0ABU5H0K6_9BACT|nr:hypothetical protein [Hyalangium sp. s54d21]MDY7226985.1 hypothetical protein [Hyalangium sp. s54d21]